MIKQKYNLRLVLIFPLISLLINACGGAGTTVADGGISGTGISMGRITNFGSIFVNGIRFDVDNASFIRDGIPSLGQAEYSVGEFITIKGSIESTGNRGVAKEVTFSNEVEGAVTAATTDNKTIEILGQAVNTDQLTVLIGFNVLSDLISGNIVEVSGVKDASGNIQATSIKLKESSFVDGVSENDLKGIIVNLNLVTQTFSINNINIEYGAATLEGFNGQALQNGQFVEVKSNSAIVANSIIASKVELENEYQNLEENTEAEIEGYVTRFASALDFDLNGLAVTTNSETRFINGTAVNIAMSTFLEIEGKVNASGVLLADRIEFKQTESNTELEGFIATINIALKQLVISGKTVVINAKTIMIDESDLKVSPLTINNLSVGDKLDVKGFYLADGTLLATKLERKEIP